MKNNNPLKLKIMEIPDWPKPGINFKDISPLLGDKKSFSAMINEFAKLHSGQKIDKIVGIDARGFLLAAALAYKLKTGLVKRKTSAKNDIGRICFGIWKQHYRNA